ncbi:MAG: hypothetical protein ACYDC8_08225 [Gammaproteobacteria bacterium]
MADIREITPSQPTWPVRQRDPAEQRKQQPPAQPRQPPAQERPDDEDDQHIDDYA